MSAGPELRRYRSNVEEVLSGVRAMRRDVEALSERLEPAATAAENYSGFVQLVEIIDEAIDTSLRALPESGTPDGVRFRISEREFERVTAGEFASIENLRGSAAADRLSGDDRDNRLEGAAGHDVLRGRGGDDVLSGGRGADTFVFRRGDGFDRVLDFDPQRDTVRIASGADRFRDLDIRRAGDNAIVEFADVRVRFDDIRPRDLDAELFVL